MHSRCLRQASFFYFNQNNNEKLGEKVSSFLPVGLQKASASKAAINEQKAQESTAQRAVEDSSKQPKTDRLGESIQIRGIEELLAKKGDDPIRAFQNVTLSGPDTDKWKTRTNAQSCAELLSMLGKVSRSINHYDEEVSRYRKLVDGGNPEFAGELAASLLDRGIAFGAKGSRELAISDFDNSILIYKSLADRKGMPVFSDELATAYHNRGIHPAAMGKNSESMSDSAKAISIC